MQLIRRILHVGVLELRCDRLAQAGEQLGVAQQLISETLDVVGTTRVNPKRVLKWSGNVRTALEDDNLRVRTLRVSGHAAFPHTV